MEVRFETLHWDKQHMLYTCIVTSAEITQPETRVKKYILRDYKHIAGKRDEDVNG